MDTLSKQQVRQLDDNTFPLPSFKHDHLAYFGLIGPEGLLLERHRGGMGCIPSPLSDWLLRRG